MRLKIKAKLFGLSLILLSLSQPFSCTNSVPAIDQVVSTQIITFNSKEASIQQAFSVFCAIQDRDGSQNIDQIYILDDSDQLLWFLTGNDIQTVNSENRAWLGNKKLLPAPNESFPVGKLRIIAYNRAGNKAMAESGLPLVNEKLQDLIPKAQRSNGNLTISPPLKKESMDRELSIQDWSGVELKRLRVIGDQLNLAELLAGQSPTATKIFIYDYLFNGTVLINSGPW